MGPKRLRKPMRRSAWRRLMARWTPQKSRQEGARGGESFSSRMRRGGGGGEVEFCVAHGAEELGVGGGAASGDGAKGAALAEEAAEVEGRAGIGGGLRFVHKDSSAREAGHSGPGWASR